MNLRKHQAEMIEICNQIRNGAKIRNIYALVTPGGGKSALPVIAGSILVPKVADAICWIAPRTALQKQGEQNFMDPLFRGMCRHNLTIRTSTNEPNPCRCENGFITTYQALGLDRGTVAEDFRRRRYILVLDEYHHAEEDSKWHEALNTLVSLAPIRIFMTGTLERGNGKKIAFTPYQKVGESDAMTIHRPAIDDDPESRVIRYNRADALAERAILPLKFSLSDGRVKWRTANGKQEEHGLSGVTKKATAAAAVYTALNTGFARELLDEGFEHWTRHKAVAPSSKLLVVTSGIRQAREAIAYLKTKWARAEIATSHETEAAHRAIDRFKAGAIDVLVTIAMAYEGLDVPSVSHLIVLTHIRSTPWLEQCLARAVRIDPAAGPYETQAAHIFAPDDILFREVCAKIEAEQLPFVRSRQHGQMSLFDGQGEGGGGNGITPLDGRITRTRGFAIGNPVPSRTVIPAPIPKTPSEIESELRDAIEAHVRAYCRANYYMPQRINGEIRAAMNKPRAEMNRAELKHCLEHVRRAYPMHGQGSGTSAPRRHKRLFPTKPVKWGVA